MQSANLSGSLKGLCPYQALIGLNQATGLAGGFDSVVCDVVLKYCLISNNTAVLKNV